MEQRPAKRKTKAATEVFAGSSQMGAIMRSLDWPKTPLGAVETWSSSWRTAISLCLGSHFPTLLWWGPEQLVLYNDAAIWMVGKAKSNSAVGQSGREAFSPETWQVLAPMLERVFTTGESAQAADRLLMVERDGRIEPGYFTFSHSAIRDDSGSVCGVFTIAIETPAETGHRLPLTREQSHPEPSQVDRTGQSAHSTARILLVDENVQRREYVKEALAQSGYQVEAVADRRSAIALAREFAPDSIVTEAIAPETEDVEWLRQLRAETSTSEVPIVMLSTPGEPELEIEHRDRDCDRALGSESFCTRELLARVSSNLEIAKLRQEAIRHQGALRAQAEVAQQQTIAILESITDGFATLDRQWRYTYVNPAAAQMLEKQPEELLGKQIWEVFPEAIDSRFYAEFQRAVTEGVAIALEDWYPPLNKWFEVRAYPGELGLTMYIRDVSETHQASHELHKERDFIAAVLNTIGSLVVVLDCQGRIVSFNSACETTTGYTFEEVKGAYLWDFFIVPEEMEAVREVFENLRETALPNHYENDWLTKEGSRRPIAWSNTIMRDPSGEVEYIIGTGIDISARRQAEAALGQSTERFQIAASCASDSIYEWDIRTGAVQWFGDIDEQLGYAPGEFSRTRQGWENLLHPDDRERVLAAVQRHLQEREPFDEEYRIRRQDGIYLYWNDRGTALWDELGTPYKWIGATTDITLRQWAQEEILKLTRSLKRRIKELQTLIEFMPIGIGIAEDPDCRHIRVNPAFAEHLGIDSQQNASLSAPDREKPIGFKVYRNGKPLESEELPMQYAAAHGVEVMEFEVEVLHESGKIVKLLEYAAPLLDEEGNIRGSVGAFIDITDRKQTEEALRHSEERYRSLAEALPQMVCMTAPDGTLEYCNQSWFEYSGLTLEQTQQRFQYEIFHPEERSSAIAKWRKALSSGKGYAIECRLRRKDGIYRWHEIRMIPIKAEGDRIVAWLGTATDTDQQKRAQEQERFLGDASNILAHALEYQNTLDSLVHLAVPRMADWCAIDLVEKDGSIQRWAVAHIDPAKEELAWDILRRYPPKKNAPTGMPKVIRTSRSELYRQIPDSLLQQAAHDAEHLEILRELGLYSGMCVPLMARGRTIGAITFVLEAGIRQYDESDLALAENLAHRAAIAIDNARLYREATDANRLKDEFLATLSHELRTPLNSILGWSQILSSRRLSEEKTRVALQTIERNARSQFQLIEDLLDVSRIITGKLRLNVTSVQLTQAIAAAIESVRPAASAKNIHLETSLEAEGRLVSGDRDRLQQVVWNLLSNAIKFTPNGGRVTIVLQQVNDCVEIRVSDTGQGIKPEFLPFVFDRFRQADSSSTRAHSGLGLGLAIVRHLTELHGGTVHAESPGEGQGATFTVRLPVMPLCDLPDNERGIHPTLETKIPLETAPVLDGVRVLVVDDEADARHFLTLLLEECGARVETAASVREALVAIQQFNPQVLISDIAMPSEDGYSLIRQVRAIEVDRGGHLPAAAVTAYARAEDRTKALKAGFDIHLPKPIDTAELIAVVERLSAWSS